MRAKEIYPASRIFGIIRDVWCSIITGSDVLSRPAPPAAPLANYAIVCAPISGGEFLCSVLTEAGLGRPREHIREFFIELCRSGYALEELMQWMMQCGAEGGYFGTTLISFYLRGLIKNQAYTNAAQQFLQRNNFRIVSLLRDPAEQAISAYFAYRTGVGKLRNPRPNTHGYADVPYDSDDIHRRFGIFRAANRFVGEFVRQFPDALEINYRDLDQDPQSSLRRIAKFLGAPRADAFRVDLAKLPQKISRDRDQMQDYLSRLKREVASRGMV